MDILDELLYTLGILRNAIAAKDADRAFEAATVFLMAFTSYFGVDSDFSRKMLTVLEQLKEHIENARFEEAEF
jgi:hypothetical protein